MGISFWRGKFNKTTGTLVVDKAAGTGSVDVGIDMDSVDFGLEPMNEHAKAAEFFDVSQVSQGHLQGPTGRFRRRCADPRCRRADPAWRHQARSILKIDRFKCIPHPMYKRELCGANAIAVSSATSSDWSPARTMASTWTSVCASRWKRYRVACPESLAVLIPCRGCAPFQKSGGPCEASKIRTAPGSSIDPAAAGWLCVPNRANAPSGIRVRVHCGSCQQHARIRSAPLHAGPVWPAGRRGRSATGGSWPARVPDTRLSTISRPAAGPDAMETATARLSSTMGEGFDCDSVP